MTSFIALPEWLAAHPGFSLIGGLMLLTALGTIASAVRRR